MTQANVAPYDAREVGNFVIFLARDAGRPLTQMALLKLIFYSHGWHLALNNQPLFRQPVEAWQHGPVVKVVWDAFKDYGKKPIDRFAERLELTTGELLPLPHRLHKDDESLVSYVYSSYASKSAFELSDLSHVKGGPWDKVWNSKEPLGRLGLRIRNDEIRSYFLLMKQRGTLH